MLPNTNRELVPSNGLTVAHFAVMILLVSRLARNPCDAHRAARLEVERKSRDQFRSARLLIDLLRIAAFLFRPFRFGKILR
jgi:hypothetical protein